MRKPIHTSKLSGLKARYRLGAVEGAGVMKVTEVTTCGYRYGTAFDRS